MADLENYQRNINRGLDQAHARAVSVTLPPDELRLIVLSDQHKGVRDGADDFQRSESAYLAALSHYLGAGFSLAVLGDVEELWENEAQSVLNGYSAVLEVEKEFSQAGRYWRFYGNHDDDWSHPDLVVRQLGGIFGQLPVWESLRLSVRNGDQVMGEVFLAHGHQGTTFSDRFGTLSRRIVRTFWRPFQRLTKIKTNSPSTDWQLRHEHDIAMYNWAAGKSRLILIAGHTHHPVFPSPHRLERLASALQEQQALSMDSQETRALRAELEAARAQEQPCYFNSGCCSFRDGQITGIEIADGQILLVQWMASEGGASRTVLDAADLAQVFEDTQAQAAPILLDMVLNPP
jgi:UDP-2,3-diacylglucosamine pyrophosphatase LpxH